jgi:hypothetical protein
MADNTVTVSATGSYVIGIDSDNDSITQQFLVRRHTGGTPVTLMTVGENGVMNISAGAIVIAPSTDPPTSSIAVRVKTSGGTEKATIYNSGYADFSVGGVRTLQISGAPSGGNDGDLVVDKTNNRLYVKVSGTWRYATLT